MTNKQLDTESLEIAIQQVEQSQEKLKKAWYDLRRILYDVQRGNKLGDYERKQIQNVSHINLIASQLGDEN